VRPTAASGYIPRIDKVDAGILARSNLGESVRLYPGCSARFPGHGPQARALDLGVAAAAMVGGIIAHEGANMVGKGSMTGLHSIEHISLPLISRP